MSLLIKSFTRVAILFFISWAIISAAGMVGNGNMNLFHIASQFVR